jgi:hypothetical protein
MKFLAAIPFILFFGALLISAFRGPKTVNPKSAFDDFHP